MRNLFIFLISAVFSTILGFSMLLRTKLEAKNERIFHKFEIAAFLKDRLSSPETICKQISSLSSVKEFKFLKKEEVLEEMKLKEKIFVDFKLLGGKNPFPDTVIIYPSSIEETYQLISNLKKINGIDQIFWEESALKIIVGVDKFLKLLNMLVLFWILFFLSSLFILLISKKPRFTFSIFFLPFFGSCVGSIFLFLAIMLSGNQWMLFTPADMLFPISGAILCGVVINLFQISKK